MKLFNIFLFGSLVSFQSVAKPIYSVDVANELCSAAYDKNNFNTQYTKSMFPLILDADGWMIGGKRELATDFTVEDLENFKRFIDSVEKRYNATVIVAQTPPRTLENQRWKNGDYASKQALQKQYHAILQMYRSAGIHAPDLSQGMDDVTPSYFFKRDLHWRPEGAQHAAKILAKYIRDNNLLTDIASTESNFQTTVVGERQLPNSSFNKVMSSVCGYAFINETSTRYETTPPDGGDLFATSDPQIYMIGTSFSKLGHYNFEGFLKESLKHDVANLAESGGQEFGAWLELFQNAENSDSTKKIIIWELLSYYNPTKYSNLQHLIPMSHNGCQDKPAISRFSAKIENGERNELIFDTKLLAYHPSQLVVDLDTGVLETKALKLRVWHESGHKTKFNLSSTANKHKNGRFVFELGSKQSDKLGKVLAVDLIKADSSSDPITQISGSVCLSNAKGTAS